MWRSRGRGRRGWQRRRGRSGRRWRRGRGRGCAAISLSSLSFSQFLYQSVSLSVSLSINLSLNLLLSVNLCQISLSISLSVKSLSQSLKSLHRQCLSLCHEGSCQPCPLRVSVSCACDRTALRVKCGTEKFVKPPKCRRPCKTQVRDCVVGDLTD